MQAFKESKPAAVQELHHQVERRRKLLEDGIDLFTTQHDGDIGFSFCSDDSLYLPELLVQDMPMKKEQSVEGLILGRSRYFPIDRQMRQKLFDILGR